MAPTEQGEIPGEDTGEQDANGERVVSRRRAQAPAPTRRGGEEEEGDLRR